MQLISELKKKQQAQSMATPQNPFAKPFNQSQEASVNQGAFKSPSNTTPPNN